MNTTEQNTDTFHARKQERTDHYEKYVKYWREYPCIACNGSGHYDSHGSPDCGACEGTGKERHRVDIDAIRQHIGKRFVARIKDDIDLWIYIKDTRTVFYKYKDGHPTGRMETRPRAAKLQYLYNPKRHREEWGFIDVYSENRPDVNWIFFLGQFSEASTPRPKAQRHTNTQPKE